MIFWKRESVLKGIDGRYEVHKKVCLVVASTSFSFPVTRVSPWLVKLRGGDL